MRSHSALTSHHDVIDGLDCGLGCVECVPHSGRQWDGRFLGGSIDGVPENRPTMQGGARREEFHVWFVWYSPHSSMSAEAHVFVNGQES